MAFHRIMCRDNGEALYGSHNFSETILNLVSTNLSNALVE